MDLQALRKQQAELHEKAKAISAKAETEDRGMTDEEGTAFDELLSQFDAMNATIARAEKFEANSQHLEASPGRKTAPETPKTTSEQRVEVGINRMEEDPRKGFKSPRHFLMAVYETYDHGTPVSSLPDNLKLLRSAAGSDEQGTHADPYGGFLLPVGFSPRLLSLDAEDDPMAGRTTNIPLATTRVEVPARVDKDHSDSVSGGLVVGRSAETVAKAASQMEFEQVAMHVYSLFGMAFATEELMTDSPISFAAIIAAGFSDEFSSSIIDERMAGTGVGQFMGVLLSPALISVGAETNQAADTIVYENIIKMRARCWRYSNAVWMYNQDCLPQLMSMVMQIGTGGVPMWQSSARDGEPDRLLGRPAIATESAKTIGDEGDLLLANWSQFLEGTYQPLQSAESIHVRFVNHERAFKFWLRNAGAPWWRSAMTPKNSTSTLSPFVVLEAR